MLHLPNNEILNGGGTLLIYKRARTTIFLFKIYNKRTYLAVSPFLFQ